MRAVVSVVVAAVLAVCCAGCGGKEIKPSPVGAGPSSAPSLPSSAKAASVAGAEEFTRFWITTLNYALRSGDAQALTELSVDSCKGCHLVIDKIDETYKAGGYMRGLDWKIRDLKSGREGEKYIVDGFVSMAMGSIKPSTDSSTVTDFQAKSDVEMQFGLARRGGEWIVTDLVQP